MYTSLEKLGLLFLAYIAYKIGSKLLTFLFYYFAAPALSLAVDLKRMGKWAGEFFSFFFSSFLYSPSLIFS